MDERLIPINGLIALLRGEGGWPGLLHDAGFQRHQLEVPVSTPLGEIRADALIYRCRPDLILLCESKSGRNIEAEQARRYVAADVPWLKRTGAIPPKLRGASGVKVRALFVGREENRALLESGLRSLMIDAPLLTVDSGRARMTGVGGIAGLRSFDELHGAGLPPSRIPVDHQSSDQDLLELLAPEVIAAQARSEDVVLVESLAERILPEWALLAHGAREAFLGRTINILQGLAAGEMRGQFRYEAIREPHARGRVVVERTPAARDPRGRAQAWQAQQRRAATAMQRPLSSEHGRQLSIDELANEGGLADD